MEAVSVFWFRRDLRINDNAGLYHALRKEDSVLPVFIFDKNILDDLEDKHDRRVTFIYEALLTLKARLIKTGSDISVYYDTPLNAFTKITSEYNVKAVFTNGDYEPYARQRDKEIKDYLNDKGIWFYSFKDQVIFEKDEILKDDQTPYSIFTPYSRKWKEKLSDFYLKSYPSERYPDNLFKFNSEGLPSLESMGFKKTGTVFPSPDVPESILLEYQKTRDFPGINGTSKLGVHLRFGTLSIRALARKAFEMNSTFLNELIWREFFQMILWYYPKSVDTSFKPEYDEIPWRNNEAEFQFWTKGETGFPIIDAGMRELNATGFMHNRVRMLTASFLTKLLLTDWRSGEAYFAKKLLDYELASNIGNWQWAAGSGCDAAPYFRIFNPITQEKKFDPDQEYIKKWIPEIGTAAYPDPIIDYKEARQRAIKTYAEALSKSVK